MELSQSLDWLHMKNTNVVQTQEKQPGALRTTVIAAKVSLNMTLHSL